MKRDYHKWFSPNLGHDMELLVFGHAGAKVLVFPTREGRFYHYEDWGLVNVLQPTIEAGNITLFCVDSVDLQTLYCRSISPAARVERHLHYERYIIEEVVPLMRAEDRNAPLISHGCSIGAYHATNLALRHPWLFTKIVALSGRYDLTQSFGPFEDLFEGHYDQEVYFITPNHFIHNLHDPAYLEPLRRMEIVLAIGETDLFFDSNFILSRALTEKGIKNRVEIWPGEAHRAKYWRQMVPLYL